MPGARSGAGDELARAGDRVLLHHHARPGALIAEPQASLQPRPSSGQALARSFSSRSGSLWVMRSRRRPGPATRRPSGGSAPRLRASPRRLPASVTHRPPRAGTASRRPSTSHTRCGVVLMTRSTVIMCGERTRHRTGRTRVRRARLPQTQTSPGRMTGAGVVATPTGLEPAASAVTGRRANQLRYGAWIVRLLLWKRSHGMLTHRGPLPNRALSKPGSAPPTGFEPVLPP